MKMTRKLRWICAAALLGAVVTGGCILTDDTPSYPELKASCEDALTNSPRSAALDKWLDANRISAWRVAGPLDESLKGILVSNGISRADANEAASCTYFVGVHVRGGFLSTHVASGYFLFTSDGELIDHRIQDIYYGM